MSGIIGSNNQFGFDFGSPDTNLQGLVVSKYDIWLLILYIDSLSDLIRLPAHLARFSPFSLAILMDERR